MTTSPTLADAQASRSARFAEYAGAQTPLHFGSPVEEYAAIQSGVGLCDRSYRATIELRGDDRKSWLHNLTTNHVSEVPAGQARYMFVCNVKGRVLFDLVALIREDTILLDLDRRHVETALGHLDRYHISEDVHLADHSQDWSRLALMGRGDHELLEGDGHGPELAFRATVIGGTEVLALRHDFGGLPGLELFVPAPTAGAVWSALCDEGFRPAGLEAIQMGRIEAGMPWPVEDIDEQVLPAETNLMDRAVSFTKGCYLGQEVVERMRAHGSLARKFVGLQATSTGSMAAGATLEVDRKQVGRVTSACVSAAMEGTIALGYLKVAHAKPDTAILAKMEDGETEVIVTELPFRPAN